MQSLQHTLSTDNKPRVHITYDIETEGGLEKKELPFVLGVLADLAGSNDKNLPPLAQREFVAIDTDNFAEVMQSIAPSCEFRAKNHLSEDADDLAVNLQFTSMADFEPEQIAKQIPALAKLVQLRDRLRELINKADSSPELEQFLERTLSNVEHVEELNALLIEQEQTND